MARNSDPSTAAPGVKRSFSLGNVHSVSFLLVLPRTETPIPSRTMARPVASSVYESVPETSCPVLRAGVANSSVSGASSRTWRTEWLEKSAAGARPSFSAATPTAVARPSSDDAEES